MENSLTAFRAASAEGYRYLETDVHATTDGVVVVHHDDVLDRTTDGYGSIAEQPWSAVRHAKVGGREPIATLATLLEELPEALFNVDVKHDAAVEPVLDTLERYDAFGRVCLASFSDARLARLRSLAGDKLLTSMGPRSATALWSGAHLPVDLFASAVHGDVAQLPRYQGPLPVITSSFVRTAHQRGIEVHVWTIDEESAMVELLDLGVDGIVTDRPDTLRKVLRERGQWPD